MNDSKTYLRRTTLAVMTLGWPMSGMAGVSHFLPGMMNIRDFLAPEKEGVYAALYLGNYSVN